jgi:hypothetical protein
LQIKAPLISEDGPIITYLDASDISTLPTREELLQLTAPGIGSENEIEDSTPLNLSLLELKKISSTTTLGTRQRLPPAT